MCSGSVWRATFSNNITLVSLDLLFTEMHDLPWTRFSHSDSSGHLTRKPYGYFICPGNKRNAVVLWINFFPQVTMWYVI